MRWARDDVIDILEREGEAIVLTSRQCLRLNALSAVIVAFLVEPQTDRDLRAHLEDHFGQAPDGRLEQILDELTRQRLVWTPSEASRSD